jgi:hypothetical protein
MPLFTSKLDISSELYHSAATLALTVLSSPASQCNTYVSQIREIFHLCQSSPLHFQAVILLLSLSLVFSHRTAYKVSHPLQPPQTLTPLVT